MESFIKQVLYDLQKKGLPLQDLCFILPSKRAKIFLKHELASVLKFPILSPTILSIEELVEDLSGLKALHNSELLFRLYTTYSTHTDNLEIEPFDSFIKWAQILLQDFNEIDRYLVNQTDIFNYLGAIKELDHWSLESNQTNLIKSHLKFWKQLGNYYNAFTEELIGNKEGYQGLIYREAANNLEYYIETNSNRKHIFLGFNALNESESQIIQGLLQSDIAHIYWDIDQTFVNDVIHDAGHFARQHRSQWKYFNTNPFNWITSHYSNKKKIQTIGIPKLVGQAKYIGHILKGLKEERSDLSKVAVVLGEENLLVPVLNSIPKSISQVNVTMGLPLKFVPLASLFNLLFHIHRHNTAQYYHEDVVDLLSHPSIYRLFESNSGNGAKHIITSIQKYNFTYLNLDQLKSLVDDIHFNFLHELFESWTDNPKFALNQCLKLIKRIKTKLNQEKSNLELEYLFRFYKLFNQLTELSSKYKQQLKSIKILEGLFNELLTSETLDFQGEPLDGLQIMGMLESRVLDFETVIISSVNEGILPSGKTNNSFIPYDVKLQNGLPTYKEKDAVYTYHFFRLLQRAKNIYILYNTEINALKGGEKSRFITQLEIEGIHTIEQVIAAPKVPIIEHKLKQVSKNQTALEQLKTIAAKGFSPSSLTNYIRNPIDFYYDKVLGVKEFEGVEENIAANTLGSVIHNTLEDLYKPLEGHFLTIALLKAFKSKVRSTVYKHFKLLYREGDFSKGKNLIVFEIAQRYIHNFLDLEIKSLNSGNTIKILAIEVDESIPIKIKNINFPIVLKGKVDRIDQLNGVTRVIDYKSGKVEQNKVEIINWEDITTDYDKYSKSFQILCYAYMMYVNSKIELPIEAGIISFKNLNSGFLKFGTKPSTYSKKKDQTLSIDTIKAFEVELKQLILEILDPNIDFTEKER